MAGFNFKGASAAMGDTRVNTFQKRFNRYGDFRFKNVYLNSLAAGAHYIRLCPKHPEHCPDGFSRVVTHEVETVANAALVAFFCTYQPRLVDEDGTLLTKLGAESECYACDTLFAVQDELDSFGGDTKKILEHMAPRQKFIFPGVMRIKADPDWKHSGAVGDDGKPAREYAPYIFDKDARQGVMLNIDRTATFNALLEVLKENPDANDLDDGCWIKLIKTPKGNGADYTWIATKASPADDKVRELCSAKDYPKLHPHPAFMKKSTRELNYEAQRALLSKAWWAGQVIDDGTEAPWDPDLDL